MAETGIQEVETYTPRRRSTVAQFIVKRTRPVYGGGAEPGVKGVKSVVGARGPGTIGDMDGVSDVGLRTLGEGGRGDGGRDG